MLVWESAATQSPGNHLYSFQLIEAFLSII